MFDVQNTCDVCGGEEFTKEAGFYYCNICQTQSQNTQEQVFDNDFVPDTGRKLQRTEAKRQKVKKDITSWECYNFVLLGLTRELIDLGASRELKDTVQALWCKYLKRIEVLQEDPNQLPKLQAYNSRCDAEIIYNCNFFTKRKYSHKTEESDRPKKKNKKNMALAEYGDFLMSQETNLADKSLADIGTKETKIDLQFTKSAEEILLQKCPEATDDVEKFASLRKKMLPFKYLTSPHIINRSRLYTILYLALLINKEEIQLGDMRRFLYEGHLSWNSFEHFMPEEYDINTVNVQQMQRSYPVFFAEGFREKVQKLAVFLDVDRFVPVQDLTKLCERYCDELNLPEGFKDCVLSLISSTLPSMDFIKRTKILPNYEARAASFIIFTLKLLFGLDGVTEFELSKQTNPSCFNFKKWLRYICYRKIVIQNHHFPTQFCENHRQNYEDYLHFIKEHNEKTVFEAELDLDCENIKKNLKEFAEEAGLVGKKIVFRPTLTPLQDYLREILDQAHMLDDNLIFDGLMDNFSRASIDFLFNPDKYVDGEVVVKNSGANKNLKLVPTYCKTIHAAHAENFYPASLTKQSCDDLNILQSKPDVRLNVDLLLDVFKEENRHKFADSETRFANRVPRKETKYYYYNPEKQFWLNTMLIDTYHSFEEFDEYFRSLPFTFQLIVKELSNMICQTSRDLMVEYNLLETNLAYILKMDRADHSSFTSINMNKIFRRYTKHW